MNRQQQQALGRPDNLENTISEPTVASAVSCVESPYVGRESANERSRFVGVFEAEFWVFQQGVHTLKAIACISARLIDKKPNRIKLL